jgi:hypothetical protein
MGREKFKSVLFWGQELKALGRELRDCKIKGKYDFTQVWAKLIVRFIKGTTLPLTFDGTQDRRIVYTSINKLAVQCAFTPSCKSYAYSIPKAADTGTGFLAFGVLFYSRVVGREGKFQCAKVAVLRRGEPVAVYANKEVYMYTTGQT